MFALLGQLLFLATSDLEIFCLFFCAHMLNRMFMTSCSIFISTLRKKFVHFVFNRSGCASQWFFAVFPSIALMGFYVIPLSRCALTAS